MIILEEEEEVLRGRRVNRKRRKGAGRRGNDGSMEKGKADKVGYRGEGRRSEARKASEREVEETKAV